MTFVKLQENMQNKRIKSRSTVGSYGGQLAGQPHPYQQTASVASKMQFINEFFETKPSTNTGTLSPAVRSVSNLSRVAPTSMQTTLMAK